MGKCDLRNSSWDQDAELGDSYLWFLSPRSTPEEHRWQVGGERTLWVMAGRGTVGMGWGDYLTSLRGRGYFRSGPEGSPSQLWENKEREFY